MKAACKYFGKCSGCTLQQFPYVKQIHDKSRTVRDDFGSLCPKINPTVPSPDIFGYRSSSKLCLHEDDIGRKSIGLYEQNSKRVLAVPDCPVHHPEINKLVQRLFGFGKPVPDRFYNHAKKSFQQERLKFLTIRYCPASHEFGVVLSHTGVAREKLEDWAKKLNLPNVSFYEATLGKTDDDLVLPHEARHLWGRPHFIFVVGERRFPVHPMAFIQANYSLLPAFISTITGDLQGKMLLDLYGGFGTYSFAAKDRFEKVALVEANPFSIEAAKSQNSDVDCIALSVEDYLKSIARSDVCRQVTDVIVNPPRSGLSPQVVQGMRSLFPNLKTLTYVSCNPATLKRDLKALLSGGAFQMKSLTPFDMFPQTGHIEIVAKLQKKI
jgi:23S rRNA (uracil1939-C5)-methyltransferase